LNIELLRIFGLKRNKVMRGWRNVHNKKLHYLYSSPGIIRGIKLRMRWTGHVARMGEKINAYRLLVGKRPLGRQICGLVNNIKMVLTKIRWGGEGACRLDWSGSELGQVESSCV
jgi:hypothetical protein